MPIMQWKKPTRKSSFKDDAATELEEPGPDLPDLEPGPDLPDLEPGPDLPDLEPGQEADEQQQEAEQSMPCSVPSIFSLH